jgi:hypothetical protein
VSNMILHNRQFIISKQIYDFGDWRYKKLENDLYLSYHKNLSITEHPDFSEIYVGERLLDGESGRYVIISDNKVYGHAASLLGIYYGICNNGPLIGSSPALLSKISGQQRNSRKLSWGPLNWFPSPGSPLSGFSRLLPDQKLTLSNLELTQRKISLNTHSGSEILSDYFLRFMHSLDDGRLMLALTAGLDSRTLLAALIASGQKFETYTHLINQKSLIDVETAKQLSDYFGIRHHIIEPSKDLPNLLDTWKNHTLESYSDADNNLLIPRGQFTDFTDDSVLIRGSCFEIGRRVYHSRLGHLTFKNASSSDIWQAFKLPSPKSRKPHQAFDSWLSWRRNYTSDLSFPDAFYFDQRLGGWLSSIEQAWDSFSFKSVHPANSLTAMSALRSAKSHNALRKGKIQKKVTMKLCPEALRIPINAKPAKRSLKRTLKRIFSLP